MFKFFVPRVKPRGTAGQDITGKQKEAALPDSLFYQYGGCGFLGLFALGFPDQKAHSRLFRASFRRWGRFLPFARDDLGRRVLRRRFLLVVLLRGYAKGKAGHREGREYELS